MTVQAKLTWRRSCSVEQREQELTVQDWSLNKLILFDLIYFSMLKPGLTQYVIMRE